MTSLTELDTLISEAKENLYCSNYTKSENLLKECLDIVKNYNNSTTGLLPLDLSIRKFDIFFLLSEVFAAQNRFEVSIGYLKEARDMFSEHPELEIRILFQLAEISLLVQDIESAKTYISVVGEKLKNITDAFLQGEFHHIVGNLLLLSNKFDSAEEYYKKALEFFKNDKSNIDTVVLKAKTFDKLVFCSSALDKQEESLTYRQNCFNLLFETGKSYKNEMKYLNALRVFTLFGSLLKTHKGYDKKKDSLEKYINVLLGIGEILNVRSEWDLALNYYNRASKIAKELPPQYFKLLIQLEINIGIIYFQKGQYKEAKEQLENARFLSENYDDKYHLALSYYYLGRILTALDMDADKIIELFEIASNLSRDLPSILEYNELRTKIRRCKISYELRDKTERTSLKGCRLIPAYISEIQDKSVDVSGAIQMLIEDVEELRNDAQFSLVLGENYQYLGEVYMKAGRYIEAEKAFKNAHIIFQKQQCPIEQAKTNYYFGINFLKLGVPDKAGFFIDESIKILENIGLQSEVFNLYVERGKIELVQENYPEAEKFFHKANVLVKKTGDVYSQSIVYFYIGKLHRLVGSRWNIAEENLKRAQTSFSKLENNTMLCETLLELSLAAAGRKDTKTASELCSKAQRLIENDKLSIHLFARVYLIRGMILGEVKKTYPAQQAFEESIRIQLKYTKANSELAETYYRFALYWKAMGDKVESLKMIMKAIDMAEGLGLEKKVFNYNNALNEISPEAAAKLQMRRMGAFKAIQFDKKERSGFDAKTVEKREVTILFTDIRGFTTASEKLSLEELTSFLNDFYFHVTQSVKKHRGFVNKFIGDAVLAVFNIDGTLPDHQIWALKAGLTIVQVIEQLNLIRERRRENPIGVGVGINSGEVVVGLFGGALGHDYTVIGDTVNTASRLQGQAKAGEVLISDVVYEKVQNFVFAESIGEKPLKGKLQPLHVWKVLKMRE